MALTKVIGSGIGTVTDNVVITSDDPTITMTDSSGTNDIGTIQSASGALILTARDGSSDGEIIFKKTDGSATDETMRIKNDGKIGIGLSSPQKLLHLKDGDIVVGNGTASNNAVIGRIGFSTDASNSRFIGIESFRGSDAANGDLRFHTFGGDSDSGERVRIHTNGVLSPSDGIALGVGTANTSSNVMDDYEEGTFTAQISTDSTYTGETQSGVYTKIGDMVFIQIRFQKSGTLNSGSNARFSLPFTAANNGVQASGFRGSVENIDTSMVGIGGTIAANNTILYLNEMTAATTGHNVNGSDLGANFQVQIQGFYKTT